MNAYRCFLICLTFLLPLQWVAVTQDIWFWAPPKPIGDGIDYEAIGFELAQGHGWATHFSDGKWRELYLAHDPVGYKAILERPGPIVADTNRPPLFPAWIATVYAVVPRGPYSSAIIRLSLAASIAIGCALFATWGWCMAKKSPSPWMRQYAFWVAWFTMVVVFTERNLRNYATDFLTEPFALMGFALFSLLIWHGMHRASVRWMVGAGVTFGMLIHCRSAFVLWLPLLPILFWIGWAETTESKANRWRLFTAFSISLFVVVCPWWIRNILVLRDIQPLGTKGTITLLGGYCDESWSNGGEWQLAPEKALREKVLAGVDLERVTGPELVDTEKRIAKEASQQVQHWIRQNISRLPELCIRRVITEWNPYSGKSLVFKLLAMAGVVGLWFHDRRTLLWLIFPLIANTIVVAGTYSLGGRFLIPTCGCYYLLVAIGSIFLLSEAIRIFGMPNRQHGKA